jgi:hypothetical protein
VITSDVSFTVNSQSTTLFNNYYYYDSAVTTATLIVEMLSIPGATRWQSTGPVRTMQIL